MGTRLIGARWLSHLRNQFLNTSAIVKHHVVVIVAATIMSMKNDYAHRFAAHRLMCSCVHLWAASKSEIETVRRKMNRHIHMHKRHVLRPNDALGSRHSVHNMPHI